MNPSAGVKVSTIIVFLGSALAVLWAALILSALSVSGAFEGQPPAVRYLLLAFSAFSFGCAAWGIATGVGIWKLRQWGRISMLIFAGLLLFVTLPAVLMVPFVPLPPSPSEYARLMFTVRALTTATYGAGAALGGWWLCFFAKKTTRDQFQSVRTVQIESRPADARPLSITIISWYLIISGLPSVAVIWLHFPTFFLGYLATGWRASLIIIGWSVAQIAAGLGLLKLKPWGRTLAIWYFAIGIINSIAIVFLPGSEARYEQGTEYIRNLLKVPAAAPSGFPIRLTLLWSVPLFGVLLWFVVTRRDAFSPKDPDTLEADL